jgi:opacity protein-like surface antigen
MNGTSSFLSVGLSTKLSPRTSFRATESASYLPFYSLGAIPGLTTAPGGIAPITSDYPLAQDSAFALSSSASLDHSVTSRSSFSADYLIRYTTYRTADRKYDTWAAGGGYSYRLSSRTSMRFGYHYRRYDNTASGVSQPTESHDINFGMDSTRPLSPTRTMTFGFNVGTSVYRSVTTSHYLVTGNVHVNRQISRSWTGNVTYDRGIQYVQGFPNPFFSDSVSAGLSGYLSPRSSVHVSGAYSNGQAGVTTSDQGFRTYSGVAGYQFALNKFIALSADYHYYHYVFDPTVVLPAGVNRGLNRQSVRVGLNLWLPLLR